MHDIDWRSRWHRVGQFISAKAGPVISATIARGRRIIEAEESFQICEGVEPYNALFDAEKCDIAKKNSYNWEKLVELPVG